MTAARVNNTEFAAPDIVNTIHQRSLAVGIIFGVASLIAAILPGTREQFFHSYLMCVAQNSGNIFHSGWFLS